MKKNILYILIAALIIAQMVSITKINNLKNQIDIARAEISNLNNNTHYEINGIYSAVEEMLKKEASLIELASTELGTLDIVDLTAPVTLSITPKEVSENTAVSIELDGETIPMQKNGTTFSVTISYDIFESASPLIVIDENGVKKTTQDDRIVIWSMKNSMLPSLHSRIIGQASYGSGTYKRKGALFADIKDTESGITFTEIRLVIKVDDEIISDEIIHADMLQGWQIDKAIPLNEGQTCIMTVIAADSIGLLHCYTVDHWVGGDNVQREPWFNDEHIYSADGKLLWKSE